GELLLGEVLARSPVELVADALVRQAGDGFGPFERRSFPRGEERGLPPDGHMVDAKLPLAVDLGLLHVHVDAEGAAVELRGADVDQVDQALLEAALLDELAHLEELSGKLWGLLGVVDSLSHSECPFSTQGRSRRPRGDNFLEIAAGGPAIHGALFQSVSV